MICAFVIPPKGMVAARIITCECTPHDLPNSVQTRIFMLAWTGYRFKIIGSGTQGVKPMSKYSTGVVGSIDKRLLCVWFGNAYETVDKNGRGHMDTF